MATSGDLNGDLIPDLFVGSPLDDDQLDRGAVWILYKYFKSKQELILACLRRQDEEFRNELMKRVEKQSTDPVQRLLSVFDIVGEYASGSDFCGCLFINAAAEFSDPDTPIHQAAIEHKRLIHQYLTKLSRDANAADPSELAEQISLLLEGAVVSAQVNGQCVIKSARNAADTLIDHALAATY